MLSIWCHSCAFPGGKQSSIKYPKVTSTGPISICRERMRLARLHQPLLGCCRQNNTFSECSLLKTSEKQLAKDPVTKRSFEKHFCQNLKENLTNYAGTSALC